MTRYELLDRIGVGGMAEIFRGKAVAAGGFEKPVAIKRILPHLSQDERFVELLIAEAKVLSLLKHRNIVQIFDVGLGDDGQYFLVMEYVDGKDLGAVQRGVEAKRRRIPFDLALHIGAEVCEALEHAHSARAPDGKSMSLVHRDVSPSNVLLSRAGEIKLTDFGIAKRAEQEQTGSGSVRGKFAYISPEQARNEHLDPRSDVFSIAILLWELITNKRLFSALGDLEALRAVREAAVQRPTEIDPRLSQEIDGLLMAALSKDPKRRPSAGQFGEKLRSLRYSLEVTVGDPATELAKIIEDAEHVERQSQKALSSSGFERTPSSIHNTGGFEEHTEATVIRIRTAAEFSLQDKGASISAARQVIDRFEEEETRLAQLSGDQMRMLRSTRDSSELTVPPLPSPSGRSRRSTAEPATARPPLETPPDPMTIAGAVGARAGAQIPHGSFESDEATRLVAPASRRTPIPERVVPRPPTQPPPLPGMTNARGGFTDPTVRGRAEPNSAPPAPEADFIPGTVHNRNSTANPGQMITPQPQQAPSSPMLLPPPQAGYAAWGSNAPLPRPTPTPPNMMGRPVVRRDPIQNAGGVVAQPENKGGLQPWMLVVGALIMALLAFAITRLFIAG